MQAYRLALRHRSASSDAGSDSSGSNGRDTDHESGELRRGRYQIDGEDEIPTGGSRHLDIQVETWSVDIVRRVNVVAYGIIDSSNAQFTTPVMDNRYLAQPFTMFLTRIRFTRRYTFTS